MSGNGKRRMFTTTLNKSMLRKIRYLAVKREVRINDLIEEGMSAVLAAKKSASPRKLVIRNKQ